MLASKALESIAHQVADLEMEVARLTKACAAAEARAADATRSGTVAIKPAVVSLKGSGREWQKDQGWDGLTGSVERLPTLEDKVRKYLGLAPFDNAGNIARNCNVYLKQLDREYGAGAVDAAIKILRKV
jgi:hypothetical protein